MGPGPRRRRGSGRTSKGWLRPQRLFLGLVLLTAVRLAEGPSVTSGQSRDFSDEDGEDYGEANGQPEQMLEERMADFYKEASEP